MMVDNGNGNTGARAVSLKYLESVFLADTLVPLRNDLICRGSMAFGSVPFSQELVDQNANLLEAKCAGVVCGGASRLLALVFDSERIFQTFVANNPLHLPGAAM